MKGTLSNIWSFVLFLVQPEDSFSQIPTERKVYPGENLHFAGAAKAIFWMVAAVGAGLLVSLL